MFDITYSQYNLEANEKIKLSLQHSEEEIKSLISELEKVLDDSITVKINPVHPTSSDFSVHITVSDGFCLGACACQKPHCIDYELILLIKGVTITIQGYEMFRSYNKTRNKVARKQKQKSKQTDAPQL